MTTFSKLITETVDTVDTAKCLVLNLIAQQPLSKVSTYHAFILQTFHENERQQTANWQHFNNKIKKKTFIITLTQQLPSTPS